MAEIQKGKISKIEGPNDKNGNPTRARVLPSTADGALTRPLTIPWWLRGPTANLAVDTEVAYAVFDDLSGVLVSRMDGEGGSVFNGDVSIIGSLDVGSAATVTDGLTAASATVAGSVDSGSVNTDTLTAGAGAVGGINVPSHTHTDSMGGSTTAPN